MAKTILDKEIAGITVPWDGEEGAYPGARIEQFIKQELLKKTGYLARGSEKEEDGNYHIRGFYSEEKYREWQTDAEAYASNVLFDVPLPPSGESSQASYIIELVNGSDRTIVTTDPNVKVKLRFTSQIYNPATQQVADTGEMGTLTIQTKLEGAAAWTTKGSVIVESMPADSTDWAEVNIGQYLSLGQQQVRLICRGETSEVSSVYVNYSVTLTNIGLRFASSWQTPFRGDNITLSYYVTGNIAKDLIVRVTGDDYDQTFTRSLGTAVYTETPYALEIASPGRHGVYVVTSYLKSGTSIETEPIQSQIMVATDTGNTILIAVNEINHSIQNWDTSTFLKWAVFNPNADTTPVTLRLMSDNLNDTYITQDLPSAANGTIYEFTAMMEIEGFEVGTTINGRMTFMSGETELRSQILYQIDNSLNFAPTAGADFILNPKQRSNSESNPATIINEANDTAIPSVWEGFEFQTDGWQTDDKGGRCLRVLAGNSLTIDYESFSPTTGASNEDSLTIELDIASRNAVSLTDPIIRMCTTYASDGKPLGFQVRPQEAHCLTTGHRNEVDQDIMFEEEERTHIALNIIYNLANTGINYVRFFVNGVINREFTYASNEQFIQRIEGTYTSQGIRIGSPTSDVDIYGIRIYKKALSATDIRQDRMAALQTIEEKKAFYDANDILVNNQIDYYRASLKYNTLLWTGKLPYINDQSSKKGDLEINILGDPSHSGTIKGMSTKGQGSSSKKYYKWNQQLSFGDTGWIDGLGVDRGKSYQLTNDVPAATKLVWKLNWASSQQSHKAGSCDMYDYLWRQVVGGNSITATPGYENARPCVKQLPFLLFTREYEGSDPVYYGQVTFGPGKGDKPTFGYDKKVFTDYLMIEGSDNGPVLTLHQVPWNEDVVESIDDEGELEGWKYNGVVSWDYDLGNENMVSYFKDAFNLVYLCSNRVSPFTGNHTALLASADTLDKSRMYWITVAEGSHARYDLFRYDWITGAWVDAGVAKLGVGSYEVLNLKSQLSDYLDGFDQQNAVLNQLWTEVNQLFIDARVRMFAALAGNHFNLSDLRFTMQAMKLLAASDNRAKNTYPYLDPVTHLICFAQDDLDTIMTTDNSGRKDKPYYVEEHDMNSQGKMYWNGEPNTLYNLMELAFPAELRSTMKAILSALTAKSGTLMDAFEDFFFWIQRYFPAVAYNEAARLLYETAEKATEDGLYNPPSVSAISQSLGDQLACERQFMKMRLTYLSSYCSFGDFALTSAKSISFRSRYKKDGKQPTYTFTLKPFMWIYPAMAVGQSLDYGSDDKGKKYVLPQRIKAGESFSISFITDNDTPCALLAPDSYSSIGDWGDKPLTGEFALSGKRLTEFSAGREEGIEIVEFNASTFKITTPNIKRLNLSGVEGLTGTLDMSKLTRAEQISLSGTMLSSVELPRTGSLTMVSLPALLTSLRLDGQTGLQEFSIDGVDKLQTVYVDQAKAGSLDSKSLANMIYQNASKELSEIAFLNISWSNLPADVLMYFAAANSNLSGQIGLIEGNADRYITLDEKIQLIDLYGNIDSSDNPLYITYTTRAINELQIMSDPYIYTLGDYMFNRTVRPITANNVAIKDGKPDITWSIDASANRYASFVDAEKGVLRVTKLADPNLKEKFTVTLTVRTMAGAVVTATKNVAFYRRKPEIGDFAYADGTFDNVFDLNRDFVGWVYREEKVSDTEYIFYVEANGDIAVPTSKGASITSMYWGLYPDSAATNGFTTEVGEAIKAATGLSSAFDTSVPNLTSSGIPDGGSYINDSYLDYNQDDGYAVIYTGRALADFDGKRKTDLIVQHANEIILGYLDRPLPTTLIELGDLSQELVDANGGATKYRQFVYMAAYSCKLYEPAFEGLNEQYKKGCWYLPAEGDQGRLYNFHHNSRGRSTNNTISVDYANESPDYPSLLPLYANLYKRVVDAGSYIGKISLHSASYCWTSTEYSAIYAWGVGFSGGSTGTNYKYNQSRVRAVAAFRFTL